ncbi:YciI family protein [Cellulomonas sp. URHD0024]|uniref:YciI family protein n=1 Tax=Cellulomonas sp. URHD0024 TaxID=1302620 RepID=UPI0003F4EF12|nr:YciI family protein [Cellulomonas sp. URHD0024]
MTRYLLSVIEPDGPMPAPEFLEPIMKAVGVVDDAMHDAGVWVFSGGLHNPSTATVLRANDGQVLTTDGPYVEGKEHLGGFTVIDVPDLDEAMSWGGQLAQATTLPIEVRPFRE